MDKLSVAEVLERAAEILTPEGAWMQDDYCNDVTLERATCFCIEGAVAVALARLKDAPLTKLSAFLSHLYGEAVKALQVIEGCNVGNGYPYLIFVSRKVEGEG